jgi:outer membrane protein OmpA-like peptidoglycan-associated protein
VRKIRLTGGEPLLRRDLPRLAAMLAAIDGLEDLALTTNGTLLATHARALREAGLQRVTVSLDALDDETFARLSGGRGSVRQVLEGIEAAVAVGFSPIKINCVVQRGVNEHAVSDLAARFRHSGIVVRFIELMDGQPPAFDRVYNQADSIWINYPEADIKDRFAPVTLRDDKIVRGIWEATGRAVAARDERYQPAQAASGDPLFTKPMTINFRSASFLLDAESMAIVNHQVLPQLEIARNMYIRVEGNTDNVGPEIANRKLSERRAAAIVEYLISRGIEKERIVGRGNGSSRPVASNKTADGRARNRRTDILFIPAARASR